MYDQTAVHGPEDGSRDPLVVQLHMSREALQSPNVVYLAIELATAEG